MMSDTTEEKNKIFDDLSNQKEIIDKMEQEISEKIQIIKDLENKIKDQNNKYEELITKQNEETSKLNEKTENQQENIENKDREILEKNKEIFEKNQVIKNLKEAAINFENKIENQNNKYDEMMTKTNEETNNKKKIIEKKDQEILEKNQIIQSFKNETQNSKNKIEILNNKLEKMMSDTTKEKNKIFDDLSNQKETIERKEEEISKKIQNIKDLENKIKDLNNKYEELMTKKNEETSKLNEEIENQKENIENKEKNILEKNQVIQSLKNKIDDQNDNYEILTSEKNKLNDEIDIQNEIINKNEQEILDKNQVITNLKYEFQHLKNEIDNQNNKFDKLLLDSKEEKNILNQKIKTLKETIENKKQEIFERQQVIKSLENETQDSKNKFKSLDQKYQQVVSGLNKEITNCQNEIFNLKVSIDEKDKDLSCEKILLEKKIEKNLKEHEKVLSEIQSLNFLITQKQLIIENLNKKVKDNQVVFSNEKIDLIRKILLSEKKYKTLTLEYNSLLNQFSHLKEKNNLELREKNRNLQSFSFDLDSLKKKNEQEILRLNLKIKELQTENEELKKINSYFKHDYKSSKPELLNQIDKKIQTIKELEKKLSINKTNTDDLLEMLKKENSENSELKSKLANMETEAEEVKNKQQTDISQCNLQIKNLQKLLENKNTYEDKLKNDLKSITKENDFLKLKLEKIEKEVSTQKNHLQSKLNELTDLNKNYEQDIENLKMENNKIIEEKILENKESKNQAEKLKKDLDNWKKVFEPLKVSENNSSNNSQSQINTMNYFKNSNEILTGELSSAIETINKLKKKIESTNQNSNILKQVSVKEGRISELIKKNNLLKNHLEKLSNQNEILKYDLIKLEETKKNEVEELKKDSDLNLKKYTIALNEILEDLELVRKKYRTCVKNQENFKFETAQFDEVNKKNNLLEEKNKNLSDNNKSLKERESKLNQHIEDLIKELEILKKKEKRLMDEIKKKDANELKEKKSTKSILVEKNNLLENLQEKEKEQKIVEDKMRKIKNDVDNYKKIISSQQVRIEKLEKKKFELEHSFNNLQGSILKLKEAKSETKVEVEEKFLESINEKEEEEEKKIEKTDEKIELQVLDKKESRNSFFYTSAQKSKDSFCGSFKEKQLKDFEHQEGRMPFYNYHRNIKLNYVKGHIPDSLEIKTYGLEEKRRSNSLPPQIKAVCLNQSVNMANHKTKSYETKSLSDWHEGQAVGQIVLRRGLPFFIDLTFDRSFDSNIHNLFLILQFGKGKVCGSSSVVCLKVNDGIKPNSWSAGIIKTNTVIETKNYFPVFEETNEDSIIRCRVQIRVNSPSTAFVGKCSLIFDSCFIDFKFQKKTKKENVVMRYVHDENVYLLFNPWKPVDQVYLKEEEELKEYLIDQVGWLYTGTQQQPKVLNWNFNQYKTVMLEASLQLLEFACLSHSVRGDAAQVVKAITRYMALPCEPSLLKLDWSPNSAEPTDSFQWLGSFPIVEKFMETKKSVKIGSCYILTAVEISLLRALGIPCRCVTNYLSAHDCDGDNKMNLYWGTHKQPIQELDESYFWCFHIWGEAYMKRIDINVNNYNDWQVFDPTPQNTSFGLTTAGPCPVEAIKQGDFNISNDCKLFFSEIQAHNFHYVFQENGMWRMIIEPHKAGVKLLTHISKSPEQTLINECKLPADEFHYQAQNITSKYKHKQKSLLSRITLEKADTNAASWDVFDLGNGDVSFAVSQCDAEAGKIISFHIIIKNLGVEKREINLTMTLYSCFYSGVIKQKIKTENKGFFLESLENKTMKLRVAPEDYAYYMTDGYTFKLYTMAVVERTTQTFCNESFFCLNIPQIKFELKDEKIILNKSFNLKVNWSNPLPLELKNCKWSAEGLSLIDFSTFNVKNIESLSTTNLDLELIPKEVGQVTLLVSFHSNFIPYVQGKKVFQVFID